MERKKILICGVQWPFVYGGAELHIQSLKNELEKRGHEVDVVRLPFRWNPKSEVVKHAVAWRLIDITEAYDLKQVDLVIATKFPAWLVKHHNKVIWAFHQFRQAYDLHFTKEYIEFSDSQEHQRIKEMVINMDNIAFSESKKIFSNSKNVANRLKRFNGVDSTPLYHPPRHRDKHRCDSYGDFILSAGRLESIKRVDLLIQAMKHTDKRVKCIITGVGFVEEKLRNLVRKMGLQNRVKLLGFVNDEELLDLYAKCFAVYYAPFDEDYGYVTLEAFLSRKPVITAHDSGGVLEFVEDGINGFIVKPESKDIALAINKLSKDKTKCRDFGEDGFKKVKDISWEYAIDKLIS